MVRDLIPEFRKGEIITADSLNRLRIDATQQQGGPGLFIDGTGAYQRPKRRRERGVWFKPNAAVPAYGVMYVTDNDTTQGELVLTTKKPDGIALGEIMVVNGPEDVASGVYGKCFMFGDVPWQALVASSETVANGDVLGPKDGQWDLYKDFPGLIAFSAKDSDGLAWVRLDPEPSLWCELKTDLAVSGDKTLGQTASAYRLKSDGSIDTSTFFDIYDELGIYRGRKNGKFSSPEDRGSQCEVRWNPQEDRLAIVNMQPHALRILGTPTANVYYDDPAFTASSTPVVMSPTGGITLSDLTGSNVIKNTLDLTFASGDTFHAVWRDSTQTWIAVTGDVHRPHRISGVTSGAVASGASTFTLASTPVIMGPIGAISEEDYTTADLIYNVFSFEIDSGGLVHAEYNEASGHWEAVQAECPV